MSDLDLTVNGDAVTLPEGTTVADLVAERTESPRGVAVARNFEMVPRSTWADVTLASGDAIEILTAAQGG